MALDILGPGSALNAVTSRPAQTTTYGAQRTWFKACTSLTAQDGTQLTNDWLNNMLAQERTAFDSTGIVEDGGDDMLYRAICAAGLPFATDVSVTPNVATVTFTPVLPPLLPGRAVLVAFANPNTAATQITVNTVSGNVTAAIVNPDLTALSPNAVIAGGIGLLVWDGTYFQLVSRRGKALSATELMAVFLNSGTYTIVSTAVKITMTGAGGGGTNIAGGGAGAELVGYLSGLTPGDTLTVTVGAGGAGVNASTGTGTAGGASTVASGTQTISSLTAGGGMAASSGTVGVGGTATGGQINGQGNGGNTTPIGGIAQPYAPFGDGGGPPLNGAVINGVTIATNNGAQGIVVIEAVGG